jgi:poly(3-hydroxybutyrate) depolymerase
MEHQSIKTMRLPNIRPLIRAAAIAACLAGALQAAPEVERIFFNGKDFKGGQLIVPKLSPEKADTKRWVVVDVHGLGGPKKSWFGHRMLKWVGEDKVIALAPVFTGDYHLGDGEAAKQLIERFEWIKKNYKVHDKMFLYGFSAGAQFVHRFAFNHPELVVGVSAHSAGSWAGVEGWGEINEKAKGIPFVLTCGELDTTKAFDGKAPYGRLEWMKVFAVDLKKRGFAVRTEVYPGVGHGGSADSHGPLIRECFLLATEGIVPEDNKWSGEIGL